MKIKDIQIDGFGVWTGLSVDSLPDGMTLFYGPNEAGKTTLMQFIRAMLYGFTPARREKYLPPVHGGTPGGAIRVTGPGGGYEIQRHSQLTDQGEQGRLTVTGQDGLTQGQHRLTSLLGQIDEPIFTNVFAIGIRELQELSTLDDTAAADELYKLSSGLDRVSLVDVLRSLRSGRQTLIGTGNLIDESEQNKLLGLIARRENLRDEVQQLTRGGRRWSELALQRRTQQQEIEQLGERLAGWEKESRCVEVAMSVYETWCQRDELAETIEELEAETHLPDDAPAQLVQLDALIQERQQKLEEVKQKRRALREKAAQIPVSKQLLDLQGRIEAAAEQATWVEALEEQIARLDIQIDKVRKQLDVEAERLGMTEEDREALIQGDASQLPDLSKQALASLGPVAREVKQQLFLLKQARKEAADHKRKADQLAESLDEVLHRAHTSDLQQAIKDQTELLASLRHRVQLGELLERLKRHYRELQQETVDLTTAEAFPVDRVILLAVPFIVGGMALIYGVANVFGFQWLVTRPDPTWGMLCILFGFMSLLTYYFGRENGFRSNSLDREDCERQIDALRRQIREVESERNDLDSTLPSSNESLEVRVRETERLLADLQAALPTYHNHKAAIQAYQAARQRARAAAEHLRRARRNWAHALSQLGLSESMSPASVRSLSEGYESLRATRRRLDELYEERNERRRERKLIAKRIESLYLEIAGQPESTPKSDANDDSENEFESTQQHTYATTSRCTNPLEQLQFLEQELARQHHWIKQRKELKEHDEQLKRQQISHHRAIQRAEQQRRALWAKCGVATAEQFYEMVDKKTTLAEARKELEALDEKIESMIGPHVSYEQVETEIDGVSAEDLEKRWESLNSKIAETEARVAQLRTQQGEIAQEMKHLASDDRLTVAQLELGCIQRRIEAVVRRWQILATTSCLLEDVCSTFERERQPETLREASAFLTRLTDEKYTRIWTPLGTNQLKIDDRDGNSLPLELLSRGTREAVFIALRLSLAAAYARRGVMLPLVLDDVLVNFDRDRAMHAAQTLQMFAELGHQVLMFTCHDHIVDIFHEIGVEVRMMPAQGQPGRATVLEPDEIEAFDEHDDEDDVDDSIEDEMLQEDDTQDADDEHDDVSIDETEEPVAMEQEEDEEEEEEDETDSVEASDSDQPVHTANEVKPRKPAQRRPRVVYADPLPEPRRRKQKQKPKPAPTEVAFEPDDEPRHDVQRAWFEHDPSERFDEVEDALASLANHQLVDDTESTTHQPIPDDVLDRSQSWWTDASVPRDA